MLVFNRFLNFFKTTLDGWGRNKFEDKYEEFMNKISYTHIMGCVVALTVGAWKQNAKADYASNDSMISYWENMGIKDSFPEIFDEIFRSSDDPPLWSITDFPSHFRCAKGDLYRIGKVAEDDSYHTFHTANELQNLPIDASLKKICKALGSKSFLVKILGEGNVDTIRDRSMQSEETTVEFEPCYDGKIFFDAYGNARLYMHVYQSSNVGKDFHCSFELIFKKEGENVSLRRYVVCYDNVDFVSNYSRLHVGFQFLSKPQALSQSLFPTLRQAGLKINDIYRNLFDKKSREKVEFEEHSAVHVDDGEMHQFGINGFFKDNDDDDDERRYDMDVDAWDLSCEIFSSKAFLRGIFGEKMWQMIEKYTRYYREDYDFNVNYTLKPLKNSKAPKGKDPDQFEVYLRISDMIDYTKEPKFGPIDTKSEHFFFIGFRFIFDFRKNEIRDVKFCDKLYLNGECITRGETKETTWDL